MNRKIVYPSSQGQVSAWRQQEKERRKFTCELCGRPGYDMHEAIVTRRDAQGLPRVKRLKIFANANMACLCRECHKKQHASKESKVYWWIRACGIYGYEEMLEWYASFEWKVPDKRFMAAD